MVMAAGRLILVTTFPGIIVQTIAKNLSCRITQTRVQEIGYLRLTAPYGYVVHDPPSSAWKQMLIGIGPFVVNTLVGLALGLIASRQILHTGNIYHNIAFMWLAVSVAMHSFPSITDANKILHSARSADTPPLARYIGIPLAATIYLGAAGSVFWLDLAYGAVIGLALPEMILGG